MPASRSASPLLPQTGEELLEALAVLGERREEAGQSMLARRLGISRATVSEHVRRLEEEGLVRTARRTLSLTAAGERAARRATRRARSVERFLADTLGHPWHLLRDEVRRLQPAMSDELARRIEAQVAPATECPHGNPIDGSAPDDGAAPLPDRASGDRLVVARVDEDLAWDAETARFLERSGLVPGARIEIVGTGAGATMIVAVAGRETSLGRELATHVWTRAARARAGAKSRR